jgi:hypothetical protein
MSATYSEQRSYSLRLEPRDEPNDRTEQPMTVDAPKTIELVTRPGEDVTRGDRLVLVSKALNVDLLHERFDDFMEKLQSIVHTDDKRSGAFQLAEIQFSAEITADGEFKLMGTGVGVTAKSGVTFVLRRPALGAALHDDKTI